MSRNYDLYAYSNQKTETLIRDSKCILVVHIYNPDPTNLSLLKSKLQEEWNIKLIRLPVVNWRKAPKNAFQKATHLPLSASNQLLISKNTLDVRIFQSLMPLFKAHGAVLLFGRQGTIWFDTHRFLHAPELETQRSISLIEPLSAHYSFFSPTHIIEKNLQILIRLLEKETHPLK